MHPHIGTLHIFQSYECILYVETYSTVTECNTVCSHSFIHTYTSSLIIHSTFAGNRAITQSTVLAFRFPVTFEGRTVFTDNVGGCISLLQSLMDSIGVVLFHNNTANEGGAITIESQGMVGECCGSCMSSI